MTGIGARSVARAAAFLLAAHAFASSAAAQGTGLAERCPAPPGGVGGSTYCPRVAEAVGVIQPRLAVLTAAGNPVPGTASTLGTRLGALPRFSLAGRVSGVTMRIPAVATAADAPPRDLNTLALGIDGALGVYPGAPLTATVGGFGSIDALGSVGLILPAGDGLARGSTLTWAAGARIGIVRESFTMPGLSLSGMYRRIGSAEYGDPALDRYASHFVIDRTTVLSARAAISKRVHVINATAGVGWDRSTSDVTITVREPHSAGPVTAVDPAFRSERAHLFLNGSWTMLVMNFVGEVGVHAGGDGAGALAALRPVIERRGVYGSLAARLAI